MGKMWDIHQERFEDASKVLSKNDIQPIVLDAKEGKQD